MSVVVCLGCGSASDAPGDPSTSSIAPEERAAIDGEVARVRQSLGEASCASTAADATLGGTNIVADSVTATYDHPTCRDGFVVDITGVKAGKAVLGGAFAGTAGTPSNLDFFSCFVRIGFTYLYEKRGSTYVLVGQNSAFGVNGALGICSSVASVTAPRDGDYKVVAAGRQLFGAKLPVRVSFAQ
jgi:hypothetical protein